MREPKDDEPYEVCRRCGKLRPLARMSGPSPRGWRGPRTATERYLVRVVQEAYAADGAPSTIGVVGRVGETQYNHR